MRPAVRPCHSTRHAVQTQCQQCVSASAAAVRPQGHCQLLRWLWQPHTACLEPHARRDVPPPPCAPHLHRPCVACLGHHRRHCQQPQSCSTPKHGSLAGACDLCFVVGCYCCADTLVGLVSSWEALASGATGMACTGACDCAALAYGGCVKRPHGGWIAGRGDQGDTTANLGASRL